MTRRVVITGLGPVTGFGIGLEPLWEGLVAGRSALRRISRFDPTAFPCQVAAEVPDDRFDIRAIVPKSYRKATKVMCRDVEFAVAGAAAAVEDAGMVTRATDAEADPTYRPARVGCHIGAGLISADVDELAQALVTSREGPEAFDLRHWGREGMNNLTPLWLLKYLPNMLACHVTIVHDCQGPSNTITCCEASSALSLGESMRVIERGAADACLTGGAEYKLNLMAFYRQLCAGRLAAASNGVEPAAVARPYDRDATGTVLGEGGGILIVEAAETAEARGARPYAEVAGFAASQASCVDPSGLEPGAEDTSVADSITSALRQAGIEADAIDAIAPFASGIPALDAVDARAIHGVFGARASSIPIITTVPNVGNCAAGNSAVSLVVAAKALREQKLPARLHAGRAEGLDAGAAPTRDADLGHVLVFTTSQGGQNAAVVLRSV